MIDTDLAMLLRDKDAAFCGMTPKKKKRLCL